MNITRRETLIMAAAFITGITMPTVLSFVSIMISFELGIVLAKVLVPLSAIEGLSDISIIGLNGFLYAVLVIPVLLLIRYLYKNS